VKKIGRWKKWKDLRSKLIFYATIQESWNELDPSKVSGLLRNFWSENCSLTHFNSVEKFDNVISAQIYSLREKGEILPQGSNLKFCQHSEVYSSVSSSVRLF